MRKQVVVVEFGAFAAPLQQQLAEQNLKISRRHAALAQKLARAILLLSIHGIATDAEVARMRGRHMKHLKTVIQ